MSSTYLFVILRRSLGFWIGLRLLTGLAAAILYYCCPALISIDAIAVASPGASLVIVLLTAGMVLFDARAVGEDLLLANFGVSRRQVGVRAMMLPALGEVLVLIAFAARTA